MCVEIKTHLLQRRRMFADLKAACDSLVWCCWWINVWWLLEAVGTLHLRRHGSSQTGSMSMSSSGTVLLEPGPFPPYRVPRRGASIPVELSFSGWSCWGDHYFPDFSFRILWACFKAQSTFSLRSHTSYLASTLIIPSAIIYDRKCVLELNLYNTHQGCYGSWLIWSTRSQKK